MANGFAAPQSPSKPTWQPPWWVEPAIYAGTQLAGAAISNRSMQKGVDQNVALQKEFAQHGIRWRVEDAKAAGLHPLYALGAQTPTFTPVQYQDALGPSLAAAGQDIGRSIAATRSDRLAQRIATLEVLSRINKNDAEAAYWRSLAGRQAQEERYRGPLPDSTIPDFQPPAEVLIGEFGSTAGKGELVSPKITASRPGEAGVVAGPASPGLQEYTLPGGFKMLLPAGGSLTEALEPLSESYLLGWGIFKENQRHYGENWDNEFRKRYGVNWWMDMEKVLGDLQDKYIVPRAFDWKHKGAKPGAVKKWRQEQRRL